MPVGLEYYWSFGQCFCYQRVSDQQVLRSLCHLCNLLGPLRLLPTCRLVNSNAVLLVVGGFILFSENITMQVPKISLKTNEEIELELEERKDGK